MVLNWATKVESKNWNIVGKFVQAAIFAAILSIGSGQRSSPKRTLSTRKVTAVLLVSRCRLLEGHWTFLAVLPPVFVALDYNVCVQKKEQETYVFYIVNRLILASFLSIWKTKLAPFVITFILHKSDVLPYIVASEKAKLH